MFSADMEPFGTNQLGDGSVVVENRGLSPFGREVIDRLNANRIMVDLSHSGQRTGTPPRMMSWRISIMLCKCVEKKRSGSALTDRLPRSMT